MTANGDESRCQSTYSNLWEISVSRNWFEVYEVASNLFAFCETRHYENTTVNLDVEPEKVILIDTCGIGEELRTRPSALRGRSRGQLSATMRVFGQRSRTCATMRVTSSTAPAAASLLAGLSRVQSN